jgi:hypothetical protein
MTVTQATWSGEDPILTILEKRDSASWYLPARWYPEMMLVQHTASGQAIPPNTMRASPTRAHLAYMFTSAAAQNAAEEKPLFTASQCTCVPEARAPSLAHADRTAARSNWSGRPSEESLRRLNASKAAAAAGRAIGVEVPERNRLVELGRSTSSLPC